MRRFAPLLLTLLVLVPAAAAHARSTEIGITDDRILLPGGPQADEAVAEWVKLGVDNVRIFAHWGKIAPKTRPAGWDPDNPASPGYQWFYVDQAINRVRRAGMTVTLTMTGPGPVWSSSKPKRRSGAYKPRPSAYAAFAKAVALRFGDRVDRYILWNEPNIHTWLMPQAKCRRHRCTPVAPHLYRGLVRAAYPAVKAADPGAQVVIGALSPRGQRLRNAKTVMRPLLFLRRFGCRTNGFKRMRSGACRRFKPARGDGFAIHPYSSTRAPTRAHPNPDDVSLGSLSRLTKTLDRLQRKKAVKSTTRRFGIYVDEYGYQTRPPDPVAGVTLRRQDRWLQEAAYVAWRNSRVRLLTQYLWRDEPPSAKGSYSGWQSGLRFAGRRAKPALAHFDTPFWVDGRRNRLWGQVRPGGRHTVRIQSRRNGAGKKWRKLATVTTDARGYFQVKRKLKAKTRYRFVAGGLTSAAFRR
jgi:hypothetical protein